MPTFNALYHFENKYDFKIGYSKRVIRPDAVDLNDEIFILNPGIANKGNSNLDPEIINYTFASINKSFKKNNLSLKIYNKSINNSIESVFNTNGNLLVQTLANAAKNNSTGVTIGFKTKLFKKISLNINSGFDYNEFEDNSFGALIKKNNGYTFIGNINLTTNIFKDKFSISCSGRQDGPNYSLLSKRITLPSLSLNINTNLLKDKLAINFLGKALLGYFATGYTDITNFNNNYNEISTRNNSTNFLLTLTYSLGKQFNDNIEENDIQNEDIRR